MLPQLIATDRAQLRPFVESDAPAVYAYWQSSPAWERFNASVPEEFELADAEIFVADLLSRDWALQPAWAIVVERRVGGIVSFSFDASTGGATIGYGLHADFWGRGLALEVVGAVLDAAWGAYPQLSDIRAHTDGDNRASIRVLEKLGFERIEFAPRSQLVKGVWRDAAEFGLKRPGAPGH